MQNLIGICLEPLENCMDSRKIPELATDTYTGIIRYWRYFGIMSVSYSVKFPCFGALSVRIGCHFNEISVFEGHSGYACFGAFRPGAFSAIWVSIQWNFGVLGHFRYDCFGAYSVFSGHFGRIQCDLDVTLVRFRCFGDIFGATASVRFRCFGCRCVLGYI